VSAYDIPLSSVLLPIYVSDMPDHYINYISTGKPVNDEENIAENGPMKDKKPNEEN